ncbi:hypothetical protein PtA15_1A189 [Puccinia triticina]|uniref:WD40 repeat-like protein n=1 Tax=Puccinia triticina TaxID=208348 RepID=A0ABY7C6W3_9BASI|nr:uncharacterized protein PtA15_1A189 [Puccinia triticina]WAQ80851.1 hypothetical protein PtA15_1A189 [Puccinia triticina]WAR51746.1 hypothetical protein PtB15_1B182 [Puccinia triticina]
MLRFLRCLSAFRSTEALDVSEVWLKKPRFKLEPLLVENDEEACHVEEDWIGRRSSLFTHPITAQQKHKILFTGSWDKTIKTWDVETQVLLSTSTGHVDFVKSIHIIPNLGLLVSGSTDRDIRLWDFKQSIESFDCSEIEAQCHARRRAKIEANRSKTEQEIAAEDAIEDAPAGLPNFNSPSLSTRSTGPDALYPPMVCRGTLKSHTRPIDSLNSYPTVCPTEEEAYSSRKSGTLPHLLVSANSMGALKVWLIPSNVQTAKATIDSTFWPHKTSINDIKIGCDLRHDIDHQTSAQLWTASADNAVLHSALDLLPSSTQRIVNILRIEQPYFVRCVLNLPLFFAQTVHAETAVPNWLITGSTDEDIRIYNLEAIEHQEQAVSSSRPLHKPAPSATLKTVSNGWFGALKGHWHEVNCLRIWIDSQTHKPWLVSSGLDGTLRKWELTILQRRFAPHIGTHSIPSHAEPASHTKKEPQFELTAEEEAELAEIMDEMN